MIPECAINMFQLSQNILHRGKADMTMLHRAFTAPVMRTFSWEGARGGADVNLLDTAVMSQVTTPDIAHLQ